MPGLVGIISLESPNICKSQLREMLFSIEHESFYNSGTCWYQDLGVYLGWTCHKGAFNDCMPIINEKEDKSLFLAGEVILAPEVITNLKLKGHSITRTDASYLIHLYEELGDRFFAEMNGWFSGLLVDREKKICYLFNDRFGMKRVFINEGKQAIYFASEAKAILSVLPETHDFDHIGLSEFLTSGCTLGSNSLFKGINILPPASFWTLRNGAIENKGFYFNRADWESQERMNKDQFVNSIKDAFPAVVRMYSKAQLPVGISLTGGFDSRMVMACLDISKGSFPCYTFGSMYRDTFDVRIARQVAKDCDQSHTVLVLGQEYLRNISRYMEDAVYRSDGYLGLSGAAELFVNSIARDIAPVRLTGNYGSEMLRGTRAFKSTMPDIGFILPDFQTSLKEAQRTFGEQGKIEPISFALFYQAPNQGFGRLAIEDSQVIMRTPFMDNSFVKLFYKAPYQELSGTDLSIAIIAHLRPNLLKIPTDRGDLGKGIFLTRVFRRIIGEALFKGEYLANHGMPHWVASITRQSPWVFPEKILLGRHKYYHYRSWIKNELSGYVRDVLLSRSQIPSCLDYRQIEYMVNSHIDGTRNFTDEIDKALTIKLCERLFVKQGILGSRMLNIRTVAGDKN